MNKFLDWFYNIATDIWDWIVMYRPRRPLIKNIYKLTVEDIRNIHVKDWERFKKINAVKRLSNNDYEMTAHAGLSKNNTPTHSYALIFHDLNDKNSKNSIVFTNGSGPTFLSKFYDKKDLHCPADLQIQERFLKKINHLIASGILQLG